MSGSCRETGVFRQKKNGAEEKSALTPPCEKRVRDMNASVIELVCEQCEETPPPRSLIETAGLLQLHLFRLMEELARSDDEQDADTVLEELVGLAAVAIVAGTAHVLPVIERGQG